VVALAGDEARPVLRAATTAAEAGLLLEAGRLADAVLRREPGHRRALELAYETRTELGRTREAIVALAEALPTVTDPATGASLRLKLARTHLAPRDDERALAWALDGLLLEPEHPGLLDVRAEAGARLGHPEAEAWIEAARAEAGPRASAARLAAAGLPERAAEVADSAPEARAEAAHLALWRLDLERAASLAAAVLAERPDDADAELVRGALAVLRDDAHAAVRHLDRALQLHGRGLAGPMLDDDAILAWRSEAWRALGDAPRARSDGTSAMTAARRYSVCAHLARVLGATLPHPDDPPERGVDPYLVLPVASKVRSLIPHPERLDGGPMVVIHGALREALARFGGNRTCWPTLVVHGRLEAFPTPPHPRAEGRRLQMRLKTRAPSEVLADLAALRARFPTDPIPRTYSGETLLWLGDHAAAEALLREAIRLERETVWAWIGLGAARMLQGALDEALDVWREGVAAVDFEGPTLFVYRAECRWRMGDLDRAAKGLDHALRDKPHRASSWLLRALVDADRGSFELAVRVASTLRSHATGAWEDAAAEAGLEPWRPTSPDEDVRALRSLLVLMRGNRSSSQAGYVTGAGQVRTFSWPRRGLVAR
jgi:tetratricopeptide (TPR) repeat protein